MKQLLLIMILLLAACTVQVTTNVTTGSTVCTQEAKLCPDGTAVGRNSDKNCEFDPCPAVKKQCASDKKECSGGITVSRNSDKNCEFDACPFDVEQDFSATYKDGAVSYVAKINKQTPCHTLNVTEEISESYPLQIKVNVERVGYPPGTVCAQAITPEFINGSIAVDQEPLSLSVYVDGIQAYATKEFE